MLAFQSTINLVFRLGRKFSKLPTFIGLIIISSVALFLIIALILPDSTREGRRGYYERLSEISTWTKNQSKVLADYLDLSDSSTFLLQPSQRVRMSKNANGEIVENLWSPMCEPSVQILIMVSSAPQNTEQRTAIRETWGSQKFLWEKRVKLMFVLGWSENETVQASLEKEAEQHDDILQENFLDTYHNLTLKSMAMLKWVNITCSINSSRAMFTLSPSWILKTDDDMFINIDRLLQVSNDKPYSKMIGCLISGAVPVKNITSKFYMPKYLYPTSVYPPYLSGTAYLLRADIVPTLLKNSETTPLIHLEDIYVTGILSRRSHIFPYGSPFFTYNHLNPRNPCKFKMMVASHQMTPSDLKTIWRFVSNKSLTAACPSSIKKNNTSEIVPTNAYGKKVEKQWQFNI